MRRYKGSPQCTAEAEPRDHGVERQDASQPRRSGAQAGCREAEHGNRFVPWDFGVPVKPAPLM